MNKNGGFTLIELLVVVFNNRYFGWCGFATV